MASKLIEVAYVVDDMDRAVAHWTGNYGVGPFFTGLFEVPDQSYRGTPAPGRMMVSFGYSNGALVELIQPLDDGPSVYHEVLEATGPGPHHVMFRIDDHDAEVARYKARGFEVVQSGRFGTSDFSMVDTRRETGSFTEIMAFGEALNALYERIKTASEEWDGVTEPQRKLF